MEEHQSISRIKQGDIGGLEELVRKYYLQAVRAAYLIVQDHDLAEDIVQTSFINLVHKINKFDDTKEFWPWFMRSVANNAISAYRQRKRNISLDDLDDPAGHFSVFEKFINPDDNPEDNYITKETCQTIWLALELLTPQQRTAIIFMYYLEFNENEISKMLNRPKTTIKWLLFSARRKLRQTLKTNRNKKSILETIKQGEVKI